MRSARHSVRGRLNRAGLLVVFLVAPWGSVETAAQSYALAHTFDDPTVTIADEFGHDVAVDRDYSFVGAWYDDTLNFHVGQAHLFDNATGNLIYTLDDPNPNQPDEFGTSVAMNGGRLLVGSAARTTIPSFQGAGQAHLFDRATGGLLHTLDDPTPTGGDGFGWSVAMDGAHVVVGAPFDDTAGQFIGQAHLFDALTGAFVRTFDDPTPTSRDNFGYAVGVSGNYVVVGARSHSAPGEEGQAHLFDATTGALLHTFNDPTALRGNFGASVAVDGTRVLIGDDRDNFNGNQSGQAHLFDAVTGGLIHTFNNPGAAGTSSDRFGFSVDIEGDRVLIGAENDDTNGFSAGRAYLFDANTFAALDTFDDPAYTNSDQFGYSVALGDGNVLIGASGDETQGIGFGQPASNIGQAHLFTLPSFLAGDFDGSGQVEQGDLNLVLNNWGSPRGAWSNVAGFTTSIVDQEELNTVLNNWGNTPPPIIGPGSKPVPEPSTFGLLGLGLAGMIRCRPCAD